MKAHQEIEILYSAYVHYVLSDINYKYDLSVEKDD